MAEATKIQPASATGGRFVFPIPDGVPIDQELFQRIDVPPPAAGHKRANERYDIDRKARTITITVWDRPTG